MKFNVNPQDYSQMYLENLNICFPNWGDMKTFDWVFNRKVTNTSANPSCSSPYLASCTK